MTDYAEAYLDWAKKSQSNSRIKAAEELARTESDVVLRVDEFNRFHDLFPVANGVVNLKTGELREHSRDHWFTWASKSFYSPGSKAEKWTAFLDEVFEGDRDLIDFVQRVVGYWLTGLMKEHAIFLLLGRGRNGKSTFINPIQKIFGEAAAHFSIQSFLLDKAAGANARPDIIKMRGKRLIVTSEVNRQQVLDSALVKGLSGGDRFSGRSLYSACYEEFQPTFKLCLLINDFPIIHEGDEALFSRVYPIPFNRVFAEHEQDRELSGKLESELEGILAWAVDGAMRWFEEGLNAPRCVYEARDRYRREMSPVASFIAEICVEGNYTISAAELHQAYQAWALEDGIAVITPNLFGRTLTKMGYRSEKKGTKIWHGLKIDNT